ncbi:MAG: sensor domain-containing diguanylate cyclase [Planctomycetes bacterium]|nr:sensor domain-containing diguanylate cyclase [Planctomycetota bacterium]
MSDKAPDVLLISKDPALCDAVRRLRPANLTLACGDSPASRSDPLPAAAQVWIDIDSVTGVTPPPCSRRIYFHARGRGKEVRAALPPGLFVRKPPAESLLEVLWAGVEATSTPVPRPASHDLPGWLLEFHDLSLKGLCHKLVSRLPGLLAYSDASLYLFDRTLGILALAETTHTRPIDLAVDMDADRERLMPAVARGGRPLVCEDVLLEYKRRELSPPHPAGTYRDRSCLIAPLFGDGQLEGVLSLSGKLRRNPGVCEQSLEAAFSFLGKSLGHARVHERAQTEARVDGLTGLFNYRWLAESLGKEIRRTQRFQTDLSLIIVDLDGLKAVNDHVGHAAGDYLLRHVASRINSALRKFDSAARMGGDEFAIMLPSTDLAGAEQVGQRVLAATRDDTAIYRETPLPITASLGVAQWQESWDASRFVEVADRVMYVAKKQGRNRLVCRKVDPSALLTAQTATSR